MVIDDKMTAKETKKVFPQYQETPYGTLIPKGYSLETYSSAVNYKPRPDDLFIVTYPKCGTTWVQSIVACIYKEGKPPFDSALEFFFDSPFLELVGAEAAEKMKRPGAIKTHLPLHILPWSPQAKYIYVIRNPKDCCVSFYWFTKNMINYEYQDGTFDDYFELFTSGRVSFGDYFDSLLSWYKRKEEPNVLFLTYEQLKSDTRKSILKIAEFMGSKYKEMLEENEEMMENVIKYSSLSYMRENLCRQIAELADTPLKVIGNYPKQLPDVQKLYSPDPRHPSYVRKGIIGDWKNYFTEEQSKRMDEILREKTKGTDIPELWKDIM